MKKISITTAAILMSFMSHAQLAIGTSDVSSASVSLEFGDENRGLLLPWVDSVTAVTGVENGTLVYDASDHKVKVKYASGWTELSLNDTGTTINPNTSVDGMDIQSALVENADAKVSIGEPTSVNGIFVLEDTDKAMVLPKVSAPHTNIINPTPGLIVYDPTTQELAVFNGTDWAYWKAQD